MLAAHASSTFVDEVARARDVPLPGSGDTVGRFRYLAQLAAVDLALVRLVELEPADA